MAEWFASGRIAEAILALVALEAVALALWLRRRAGLAPLLCNLAAAAGLLLALRGGLTDAPWPAIAAPLALALFAHLAELWLRLRGT